MEDNLSYIIRLKLYGDRLYKYYYSAQSDYFQPIFMAEINSNYFQWFPVLNETNILLNLTTIEKGNKILIEFYSDYRNNIKVYGYYSNDTDIIPYDSGKELDFITDKVYYLREEVYIMKNSSDLLYVILRVSSILDNHNSNYYFSIKYRMQEPYDNDIMTMMMSLLKNLSNRKLKEKYIFLQL